ncbi:MAG TPA: hypothetical protein ENO22_11660 [candidate division Zixibacteria bacterium]|nr:hypothetical protein [candidate division Zixibacteria bacterium]
MPVRRSTRYISKSSNKWNRTSKKRFANGKPWTPTEVKTLRKIYKDTPTKDIARKFRRTVSSVQAKAGDLGLKKTKTYLKKMRSNQWR